MCTCGPVLMDSRCYRPSCWTSYRWRLVALSRHRHYCRAPRRPQPSMTAPSPRRGCTSNRCRAGIPAPPATYSRLPSCSRSSPCCRRPTDRESVTTSWLPPPFSLGWHAPAWYALLFPAFTWKPLDCSLDSKKTHGTWKKMSSRVCGFYHFIVSLISCHVHMQRPYF
jgi:hypothetical protein